MPDPVHLPSIPVPTIEPAALLQSVLALKQAVELLAGLHIAPPGPEHAATPYGPMHSPARIAVDRVRALNTGTLAAQPLTMPVYAPEKLPAARLHNNAVVIVRSDSGGRLLFSDGTHWREAQGLVFVP